jgi:SAM-dependent MidA family methyltransferase
MQAMAPSWHEGAMLTIDYGGAAKESYHRRPAGTLRAYRNQERLHGDSVYELPGRQDITADVNFEDLAMWAGELGWETSTLKSLAELAPDAPGADAFRSISFKKV